MAATVDMVAATGVMAVTMVVDMAAMGVDMAAMVMLAAMDTAASTWVAAMDKAAMGMGAMDMAALAPLDMVVMDTVLWAMESEQHGESHYLYNFYV